ncbi:MAG: hypothetical protein HQK98_09895 [Nitrospirae bacterium]|nr:hypothetical protein [Nitrospirota bacterium]
MYEGAIAERPQTQQIGHTVITVLDRANTLVVSDSESYGNAAQILKGIKALEDQIKADFAEPKKKAHDAHKAVLAQEKGHLDGIADAVKVIKQKMMTWKIADDKRIAAERLEAQRIAKEKAEEEKLKEAIALEALGEMDEAEAVLTAPIPFVPPATVMQETPKVSGIITRKTTKYRIIDAALIPREYLMPDEKKIGGVVRAMGMQTKIAGIEAYEETVMSVRGAA